MARAGARARPGAPTGSDPDIVLIELARAQAGVPSIRCHKATKPGSVFAVVPTFST